MQKILTILRCEIYALLSRKSFWFGALGVPAIAFLIYAGIAWINRVEGETGKSPTAEIQQLFTKPEDDRPYGVVDHGLVLKKFPQGFLKESLIGYANNADGLTDLDSGKIGILYVIPEDYVDTGKLYVYTQEYSVLSSRDHAHEITYLINYNLLGSDEKLLFAVENPLAGLTEESIAPASAPVRSSDNQLTFILPYAVMMLFYISILGSSGMLLNSITKEKETRMLEILLVSTNPFQILVGKIIGLGLVGLFQVGVWIPSSFSLLRLSGDTFQLPPEFQLDGSIIAWGLVFSILGYLVYSALMAGIGALVPNLRESSQATTIVALPMMIPIFLISALIEHPNSLLTVILSIFPFTAPTTMMLRLAATPLVPVWQILLAVVLLIATDYLTIRAVAGLFRAQTMLSGQPFKLKTFALGLIGKA